MSHKLLAALLAGLALGGSAIADNSQESFAWNGWYVGVNVGGIAGQAGTPLSGDFKSGGSNYGMHGTLPLDEPGVIAGGQAGYNWQLDNNWLIGVEADLAGTSIAPEMHISTGSLLKPWGTSNLTNKSRIDYFGTLRARAGYFLPSNVLIYTTAGLAYGGVSNNFSLTGQFGSDHLNAIGKHESTDLGWTVGAGAEYPVTQNISLRVEYLYADLGKHTLVSGAFFGPNVTGTGSVKGWTTAHIARLGVNYAL